MDICKNCNNDISGKFCSNCGFPKEPTRIDGRYIVDEIRSVINFDKGFFYTIRELFIRPGATVKRYIDGDRKRIVKPIIFLIICSFLYTIGQQFLSYETGIIQYGIEDKSKKPVIIEIFEWFARNYGYANILMAIFIAMWIKLLYRKYDYNYYEIYILLCFIMGVSVFVYTLLGITESIVGLPVLNIGVFIALVYSSWAIGQFFDQKKKINYLKGLLSYLFGFMTGMMTLMIFGYGLEKLLR